MATAGAIKVKGYDAAYYFVKDLDRATKFYTDLFQMEPTLSIPGMVSEYTFPAGETFGLYKPHDGTFRDGHGILFAVDDIEAVVADLKTKGVSFEDDGETEETPVCFMAYAYDTEGNRFILHERKAQS
jgi:predicted enzyme related to lactoylglutathione lyase